MKNRDAVLYLLIGVLNVFIGGMMSSGIWKRIQAVSWPLVEAKVVGIDWSGGEDSNAAIASIQFTVPSQDVIYSDSIFDRPWRRKNVQAKKELVMDSYQVGSTIQVRFDGTNALLKGFPKDFEIGGVVQLVGGFAFLTIGTTALIKNRSRSWTEV